MSTYKKNLQQAALEVLTDLQRQQQAMEAKVQAAQYSLYYAQGVEITARNKLNEAVTKYGDVRLLHTLSVQNDILTTNLLTSATESSKNVAATVSISATAASNVQIASKAVAQLAVDIDSAFNIASAADFSIDIYEMTLAANKLVVDTAYVAEEASQQSMDASIVSSEIIAAQVLKDAASAKVEVEMLLQKTEADFSNLAAARANDSKKVNASSRTERAAEGALKDALCEYEAIETAYARTNKELNYGLAVTPSTDLSVNVGFLPYEMPFDLDIIPPPNPRYFLTIVPTNKQDIFTLEKAEMNFTRQQDETTTSFIELTVNKNSPKEYGLSKTNGKSPKEVVDSDSKRIVPGQSNVAFLYIELSLAYKKFTNSYDNLLSAPSQPFILTTILAGATDIEQDGDGDISFNGEKDADKKDPDKVEYRCMFLPTETADTNKLLTAAPNGGGRTPAEVGFYFNLTIAEQVAAANYTRATSDVPGKYSVTISPDTTTDNFGNLIDMDTAYIVAVLSILPENAEYQSNLAFSSRAIHPFS